MYLLNSLQKVWSNLVNIQIKTRKSCTGVVLLSVEEKSVSRRRRSLQRMLEAAVIARRAGDDSYISLPDMKMMLSREVSLFQVRKILEVTQY